MTTTPNPRRLDLKIRRSVWIEAEHPRDRKGRFIEKGAWVRVWGGFMGRVFDNVGGGRIEIVREDGKHVVVHRNYLTVITRPDGSSPTDKRDANPAALPEVTASADADVAAVPETKPDVAPEAESTNVYDLLRHYGEDNMAALVRQAARDYSDALDNGTPDDEADERDGLLAVLDDVEARFEPGTADTETFAEALTLLREAAVAEPPAPGSVFTPVTRRLTSGGARQVATAVDEHNGGVGLTVDGEVVTITDPVAARSFVENALAVSDAIANNDAIPGAMQSTFALRSEALRGIVQTLDSVAENAKPGYSEANEEGDGDDRPTDGDRGEALPGAPAEGARGDQGPGDVLPDPRGRDAGADRGDGGSPEGTGPGGRGDGGPAEPVRGGPVDGGVAGDQGQPAAAGGVDDAPEPGGRGPAGSGEGLPGGEDGTAEPVISYSPGDIPRLDSIPGTVRLSNGGEATGEISTLGYGADLEVIVDGRRSQIPFGRVTNVTVDRAPEPDGFERDFGDLRDVRGTVRTTNGGEISGVLTGSRRRGLNVRHDDGTNQWLDSSRIATVRRDTEEETVTLDAADVDRMRAYLAGETDEAPILPPLVEVEDEDETVTLDPAEIEATIAGLRAELTDAADEDAEQDAIDAAAAARRERQRVADNIDLYGTPEIPTDADLAAEERGPVEPRVLPPLPEVWQDVPQGARLRFDGEDGIDGTFVSFTVDRFGRAGTATFVDDTGMERTTRIYEGTKPERATPNPEIEARIEDLIANARVEDNADGIPTTYAPAKVGTWTAPIDPVNEGLIQVRGDYGVTGEMRATLNGWRGKINPSSEGTRYGETQPDPVLVTGATPQEVLDSLYDTLNGEGAAARTRAEVAAGRAPAPEVPLDWASIPRGSRIRLTDPETNEQFDAFLVSQYRSSWGEAQRTVYFVPDDGTGTDPDLEGAGQTESLNIDPTLPPRPAMPRLGQEGADEVADHDDDVLDDYEVDPFAVPVISDGQDFRPTGVDDMAPAGKRAKLDANMAALRTLRALQAEGRAATPEEQSVLARWAGWGGLPEVFDPSKPEYATERAELEDGLLAPAEIREARRNTLNAHYTDARVVQALWDTVAGLGFNGGRVLEPGSGSGTFIGLKPENTDMVGVELDSTTAAVSKYLYPSAMIRNESFADTNMPEGAFDAAVGNVPFGRFALTDPTHNPDGHSIHNHFILKSLALTRPGGIVASLTSRYTLDSLDPTARKAIAEVADLVGAVRLPNGSHRRTAETDVIEDVLIFRKRLPGEEPQADQSWVTSTKRDINGWSVGVNDYFIDRPENVLGELTAEKGRFGGEVRVKGDRDMPDLSTVLNAVVADAKRKGLTATPRPADSPLPNLIQPGLGARYEGNVERSEDGTFTIATSGAAVPIDVPTRQRDELTGLLGVRDAMMNLLDAEAATAEDTDEIAGLRQTLNDRYDAYVGKYGPINRFRWSKSGSRLRQMPAAFTKDPKSDVVAALESYEPPSREDPTDVGRASKSAIFTTRAVAPRVRRTSTDDPGDALTLSMDQFGYVNLPAIAKMLGTDEPEARRMLGTLVFEDPPLSDEEKVEAENAARLIANDPDAAHLGDLGIGADTLRDPGRLVPAAEYLSGNVRKKLAAARVAAEVNPEKYAANVEALRGVVPRDLTPEEIQVNLGAAWIPAPVVADFVNSILGIRSWDTRKAKVAHSGGSIWIVDSPDKNSVRATEQWGTPERPFHNLVQTLLEQRSITVQKDGKRDLDATLAAQAKADEIQERFREWLWEDPDRTRQLAARYNDQFNSIALRTYDGSGRTFEGMSEDWQRKVQPHVKNAVERIVNEPTAMLAHVVGAGKTAEMVMGTAELKRLGLSRKPAVVVPNHMLEQFTREYLEIYPAAKILTAGQGMNAAERREFVARAATGDWDAVIMTQGAFEGIPMGARQQQAYIDREMADMRAQLDEAQSQEQDAATKRTVKKMETALLRAEEALKKKLAKSKDLGVSFEQTGIDYLMVDEAHMYSNLRTLSNIQGAGTTGSDKATDLHMKMEYLRENSRSGRVATFATGTPIRNTVTQAYVMQRFLRPDLLREAGVYSFDQWAGTFGEVVEEMELKPEGQGYRQTQRFAKFKNVPEFLRMFHTFADVKLAEDLNLPRPDLTGGQAQTIAVPRSDALAAYVADLGNRADEVRSGAVDPTEDNMLKISTDGRKAALSMKLVGGEHEPGKIEAAADRIAGIYESNKDKVFADPRSGVEAELPGALQIAFLDMGTPSSAREKGSEASVDDTDTGDWNAYDHLKSELVARGVPEDMIRYVHEAKNDSEKAELFAAAREGRIAVLFGSSEKMGVGTNMQRRAKALHHIDAPWRPADVEQRDGRIHRQGNWHRDMGETVDIYRYVTEGSFDAYMWQTLERKAKFINQVMKGSLDVREIEDIGDTAMSYAEVKALATGNPDLLDKAKADTQVTKLSRLARNHTATQASLAAEVERLTNQTATLEANAVSFARAMEQTDVPEVFEMDIDGQPITAGPDGTGRTAAGALLRQRVVEIRQSGPRGGYGDGEEIPIASYAGHVVTAQSRVDPQGQRYAALRLQGVPYEFAKFRLPDLGEGSGLGMVTRIENFVNSLPRRHDTLIQTAASNRSQLADANARIGRGFNFEADLKAWKAKAERLNAKIQRDEQRREGVDVEFDPMIDTDRYDDPRTRSSAETYVPPPEEQPKRVEVLADSLSVGARIEFVQGEASGTLAEGQITGVRQVGKFVFVTIEDADGKEYTRAFESDTPVVRLADPASVTGVKNHVVKWVLELKGDRVVVEAKLFGRGKFDEDLHPRDRRGRFVETGAEVRIWGGARGRIVSIAKGGRLKVERADGVTVTVDAGNVEVVKTPEGRDVDAATPNAPGAGAAAPDAPAAAAPAAEKPDLTPDGVASGLDAYTTSPVNMPAATGPDDIVFTGPNGERAVLAVRPDGSTVGMVSTDPARPGEGRRFESADDWAAYVDSQDWSPDEGAASIGDRTPDQPSVGDLDTTGDAAEQPPASPDDASAAGGGGAPSAEETGESLSEQIMSSRAKSLDHLKKVQDEIAAVDLAQAKPSAFDPDAPIEGKLLNDILADPTGSAAQHLVQDADGTYRFSPERAALHAKIIASLLDGFEGNEENPRFHVMGGGPAAGKSTMEKALPEISEGLALLNADEIKEMLPEYLGGVEGSDEGVASLVHEESSYLVKSVMVEAFNRKVSVTLDGTGDSGAAKMKAQIESAREKGYTVNGYYVTAETEEAVRRAEFRATKTGRYVPNSVIRGTHKTVSTIFPEIADDFDSVVLYDTMAPRDENGAPALIGRKEAGGAFEVSDQDLYDKFLTKADEVSPEDPTPGPDTIPAESAGVGPKVTPDDSALAGTAAQPALAAPNPDTSTAAFGREDGAEYSGDPVDDDEAYQEHVAFIMGAIDSAVKAGGQTIETHTIGGDGQTWTPERAALHKEILDEFYAKAAAVPSEGKAIVSGGLGGAGKGTTLKRTAGVNQSTYITVNPDDFKEAMAARGMVPEVEGLSPMEATPLIHEEASYLALALADRAYADRKNLIWDITMSSSGSVQKRVDAMRAAGYEDIEALFVDIPVETSVERALGRHRSGMAKHRNGEGDGGRFVNPAHIRSAADDDFSSANRRVFEDLKPQFDHWSLFDNSKAGQEAERVEESGTRPSEEIQAREKYAAAQRERLGPIKGGGSAAPVETPPAGGDAPAGGGGSGADDGEGAGRAADTAEARTSPASMSAADIEAAIAAIEARDASQDGDAEYLRDLKKELASR